MQTAKLPLVGDTNYHTCVIISILFAPSFLRVDIAIAITIAITIAIIIAIIVANHLISTRAHRVCLLNSSISTKLLPLYNKYYGATK
jgi:hypothetical protein